MSGTTAQIELLQETLQRLRLATTAEHLPGLLEEASKKELSYSDFLEEVLSRESAAKHERHTAMRTAMARFPFQKTLESFDFRFQPSLDPKLIRELATGRFIANGDNVLLLGPPGVGKTHRGLPRAYQKGGAQEKQDAASPGEKEKVVLREGGALPLHPAGAFGPSTPTRGKPRPGRGGN